MRKRNARRLLFTVFTLTDALGATAGFVAAYFLRFNLGILEVTKTYRPADYLFFLPVGLAIWLFWLDRMGCYDFRERAFNQQILRRISLAGFFAMMTIIAWHFFERNLQFSRLMYPVALVGTIVGVAGSRLVLDRLLAHMRRAQRLAGTPVLILGANPLALNLAQRIRSHAYLGLSVMGLVPVTARAGEDNLDGFPLLGDFADIRSTIRAHHVEEVIIAQPDLTPPEILDFMLVCEKELVDTRVVPNLLESMVEEMRMEQIDGIPLFGLRESPLQGWSLFFKRAMDIGVSAVVLVVLSPLLLLIALAVKLGSPGPVFYKQRRVGIDGTRFNMIKFRSMQTGAEDESGPVMAQPTDPRVTPLGRLLRRTNLDELPQFFNVLRGDMSLVGPRPERPHFVKEFRESIPRYMGRHRVKSGITGWAQVHGLRGNTAIDERIKFDLYYIENWSIWLDIKILIMTLRARENAY